MKKLPGKCGHWVAHRGIPAHYPDNSLEGLRAVLEAGVGFVEFDIQLTLDGVPLLFHDANMLKATGVDARVGDLTWEQLHLRSLPSLAEVVALLADYPETTVFAEIKTIALRCGVKRAMEAILTTLAPIRGRCVLISFHASLLMRIRECENWPIGWIFETWSETNRRRAKRISPEYLFVNYARIPDGERLFAGPWHWVVYEISDFNLAQYWLQQGAALIETNDLFEMVRRGSDNL
ncbi:MAG: hypothetical protein HQL94_01710 [Magnetococcales bacterium]|nr:hypothetical protein [Magnetococcales bacterium]MBF0438656.1 hypothetical protein [Magnetococcales bacterium]